MAFRTKKTELKKPNRRFIGRIDRRIASNFDWVMFGMVILLIVIALINLYSATRVADQQKYFATQFRWSIIGLVFLSVAFIINYRLYEGIGYYVYLLMNLTLLAVLLFGPVINGARRWLDFGGLSFQPSELAKIGLVMAMAKYLASNKVPKGYTLRELLIPMGIILLPTLLIMSEPDLGTSILMIMIAGSMILFAGVRRSTLITLFSAFAAIVPLFWFFFLKDYQRTRIITLFNPDIAPLKEGYHIKQSLIAVGSGKWFGKGYLEGTQYKLNFLPEHHTDFIFSVFAEEWGFFGCVVLLALYFGLVIWCMNVAIKAKDRFAAFMAVGLAAIIFWHVFINIGMVIGLMPVVGMPLPFMSYGRSSLITMMIVVGLLLNISSRKYVF